MRQYEVGDVVEGRYLLRREIARGGGGIVFEAEHRITTRLVAIKVLSLEQQAQSRVGIRLLRESRALTVARHPNIVQVLDAGNSAESGPYLVMELLEGRPLDGLLATRGRLCLSDAVWTIARVADGAAALHRHGLVHRDIKPSNVFVSYSREGEEGVTLLDFGAATHEDMAAADRVTSENGLIGTPEYMAPEQLVGEPTQDQRIDVYGLGVLLFECLLGEVPHSGTFGEILLKVHTQVPVLQRPDVLALPPEIRSVLARAMAFDRDARFENASHFSAALRASIPPITTPVCLLGLSGTGDDAGTSRRRFARAPYVTPVAILHDDGRVIQGRSQDISTGGLLVLAADGCDPERIVSISFALPLSGEGVVVQVVGRWAQSGRRGTVLGFQFQNLTSAYAETIQNYVARLVACRTLVNSDPDTN